MTAVDDTNNPITPNIFFHLNGGLLYIEEEGVAQRLVECVLWKPHCRAGGAAGGGGLQPSEIQV